MGSNLKLKGFGFWSLDLHNQQFREWNPVQLIWLKLCCQQSWVKICREWDLDTLDLPKEAPGRRERIGFGGWKAETLRGPSGSKKTLFGNEKGGEQKTRFFFKWWLWPCLLLLLLFLVPCSLFLVPCSLFLVPCSLFLVPCSLFLVPCSLFLVVPCWSFWCALCWYPGFWKAYF